MLLHGEQYLSLKRPLKSSDVLKTNSKVIKVQNKGEKGVLTVQRASSFDPEGKLVIVNEITCFIRGAKAKKELTSSDPSLNAEEITASSPPSHVTVDQTADDQAALYRLSGDLNPLHM